MTDAETNWDALLARGDGPAVAAALTGSGGGEAAALTTALTALRDGGLAPLTPASTVELLRLERLCDLLHGRGFTLPLYASPGRTAALHLDDGYAVPERARQLIAAHLGALPGFDAERAAVGEPQDGGTAAAHESVRRSLCAPLLAAAAAIEDVEGWDVPGDADA